MCCSCPSSLKARSGADQQSGTGSRSCPKKTILLPSSASSLSLHSKVTHCLLFLSLFVLSVSAAPPRVLLLWLSYVFVLSLLTRPCASDLTAEHAPLMQTKRCAERLLVCFPLKQKSALLSEEQLVFMLKGMLL